MTSARTRARLVRLVGVSLLLVLLPTGSAIGGGAVVLTGRLWDDVDGDGVQDVSEAKGIGGLTVTLRTYPDNSLVASTSTAADGTYRITAAVSGDHVLRVTLPEYVSMSSRDRPETDDAHDSDYLTNGTSPVLYLDGVDLDLDGGVRLFDQQGDVWFDRNGDRTRSDGEQMLQGVLVQLVMAIDTTRVVASARTDAKGRYRLLIPADKTDNTLKVRVTMPEDMTRNPAVGEGLPEFLDAANMTAILELPPHNQDLSFGLLMPVRVGDRVWDDRDLDGRQDPGEPGIPGVVVSLLSRDRSTTFQTATTNANGVFRLTAPSPGKYVLWVRLVEGGKRSPMRTDLPESVDSDVRASGVDAGYSPVLTLAQGGHRKDLDAGMKVP